MPTRIFDWVARTAMLAMAGLVTLSILGAIAAMTNDIGTRVAGPRGRPPAEGPSPQEPENAKAPSQAGEGKLGNEAASAEGAAQGRGQGAPVAGAPPAPEDEIARWLEAIAYALLALAGIGALAILMLWSMLRELRRIGDRRG